MSYHNIAYMMRLMTDMRTAIKEGTFPDFVRGFLRRYYGGAPAEAWVKDAMAAAGIEVH